MSEQGNTHINIELALDLVASASRCLEEQKLTGESWTVSIWPKENGRFTVWFQVECAVGDTTKKTNSKVLSPTLFSAYSPFDLIKDEISAALHELRA